MKLIIHHHEKISRIISLDDNSSVPFEEQHPVKLLQEIGKRFPEEIIGWCDSSLFSSLDVENWNKIFHHEFIMASYSISGKFKLLPGIGYVENSPFLKINFKNTYPTWQMSTDVGGVSSKILNLIDKEFFEIQDFALFLNTIAKQGQIHNLFCYSEPRLLSASTKEIPISPVTSLKVLFKFVKQNYKLKWSFILLVSYILFEGKFYITEFIKAIPEKSYRNLNFNLSTVRINSSKEFSSLQSVDVIIPTLNRKPFLINFLIDLQNQTLLPTRVIIVEQNPVPESKSELDFLYNQEWPFKIIHHFTHQPGACHARNWALERVESEWVFFGDDDIKIDKDFLQKGFEKMQQFGSICSTFSCVEVLGKGLSKEKINQSTVFGAGNSIVKSSVLEGLRFTEKLEFGYGEDMDFGVQIRNAGVDVIHFPTPQIHHLKANVGGFRTKFTKVWELDGIKVQPAPTVLWIKSKHFTREQFFGYKIFYFISQFQKGNYNLFTLQKRWKRSYNYSQNL